MPRYPAVIYFKTEEEREEAHKRADEQHLSLSQLGQKLFRELPPKKR